MQQIKNLIRKFLVIFIDAISALITVIAYACLPVTKKIVNFYFNDCGIQVNGVNKFDPQVGDNHFYSNFVGNGFIGLSDAYVKGYYKCDDLKEFFTKILQNPKCKYLWLHPSIGIRNFVTNRFYTQSETAVVELGKNFDENTFNLCENEDCKTHSSGYWRQASTLQEAFIEKCELVAQKLKLKSKMRVLDAGCGEGVLCKHLAKNYGVSVIGVNVSQEAIQKATRNCFALDVKYQLKDCRKISGKFDRIICIQLIELFGASELRSFFELLHKCLNDDGLVFLECTCISNNCFPSHTGLFENFCNTTLMFHYFSDVMKSINGLFVLEDLQNISPHGVRTLSEEVYDIKRNWSKLLQFTDENSLKGSEATFSFVTGMMTARRLHPLHIILSKNGITGGYDAVIDTE